MDKTKFLVCGLSAITFPNVLMLQANEMLLTAKGIKNPEEREAKLREALQVCKQFEF
jgi:hypothetical protein